MPYETPLPEKQPERGYYHHHKHDPDVSVNNYAYYFDGVGLYTEDNCRPEDAFQLVYRPLYEADVYKDGYTFYLRPLRMIYESVEWKGQKVQRFTKITDPDVIAQLSEIRKRMYPPDE